MKVAQHALFEICILQNTSWSRRPCIHGVWV